ncbi:MAG TPA: T9SS type A sorting domain-containing protein [Bacteroidia bacterium]|nr:T9SS type A sorting domain-containing protein [Bacteroidia bacterium]
MKKIYLLIFSIFALSQMDAQTYTLTQSNSEGIVGDFYYSVPLDTNSTAMPMNISGASVTWSLNALTQSTAAIAYNSYSTAASATNSANYPGTNLVQTDTTNATISYFKTTTNKLELLGVDAGFFDLNYNTNSATIANYPMSFGTTFTDNSVGGTMTIPSQSLSGPFNGTVTTTVDGSGTLNINNSLTILSNCLRVRTRQILDFNLVGGLITGTIDQNLYNFYHSSSKFPVFSVSYSHIVIPPNLVLTSGLDQVQTQVSTLSTIVIGVKENQKNNSIFSMFPNPVNAQLGLHFVLANEDSYTFEISNALGQVVKTVSMPNLSAGIYNESINTSDLSTGMYTVKVIGKNSQGTQKLIIQK